MFLKTYRALTRGRVPGLGPQALGVPSARAQIAARAQAAQAQDKIEQGIDDQHLGSYDSCVRPRGALIWVHVPSANAALALVDMTLKLEEAHGTLSFVVTTADLTIAELPFDADVQVIVVPDDTPAAVSAFLDFWRPDLGLFIGYDLRPNLIDLADARSIPIFAADGPEERRPRIPWRFAPQLRRDLMGRFEKIFVGDRKYDERVRMGARSWTVEEIGFLEPNADPPDCETGAREAMAALVGVRPRFLAMSVSAQEEDLLLDAFRYSLRRAHRLVMFVVPANTGAVDRILEKVTAMGLIGVEASQFDNSPDAQVVVASDHDQDGMWYRLAPVSFLGTSFQGGGGISPLAAAALGSAIIHGPDVQCHKAAYQLLRNANASVEVHSADDLAQVIESLQAPDRVASIAHAAWTVASAGAEVRERICAVLLDALARKGAM
ncbi:3-deoxy-D-manno-octulosonic acid transferase [Aliiroseovarius sp. PTFE2010]|uniref:3-deoxy-D-manno-octulosonic acid transferase n=1 Tax=Aliiroseovarius sp. PTFE2010 TaxID=3417190 RepID=UPI003CEF3EBF